MSAIPIFPKLYSFKNKKIYEWSIKIEKKSNSYIIVTEHGQTDGKIVVHEKEISEGKAKRTVLEQAALDAQSKWNNKKNKELYVENIENTETKDDLDIVVRPMLANKFNFETYKKTSKAYKIPFPAFIQKKYDGLRCISYLKNDKVILESRKGIEFENFTLLREQLYELFKTKPSNFYLDGELYSEVVEFQTISGLIRLSEKKATPEEIKEINKIEYYIYDCIDLNDLSLGYSKRYEILKDITKKTKNQKNSLIKLVDTIEVDKLEDVKKYHDQFVEEGYEGLMVRDKNGPYEIQKRSKYLQKYKEFMEEEFKIIGFHEGSGDEKGAVVWDCITSDGKAFAVRPKGTFETRQQLYDNGDKYIGKLLTVIFMELTPDGIPRILTGKDIRDIY
jgi:DNA ligase-1